MTSVRGAVPVEQLEPARECAAELTVLPWDPAGLSDPSGTVAHGATGPGPQGGKL